MRALCDEFGAIPVVTLKQRLMPLCLIKPSDIDFYWNNQEPPEDTGQLILKLPSGVKLMN
jgi:hypothetical protein